MGEGFQNILARLHWVASESHKIEEAEEAIEKREESDAMLTL